MAGVIMRRLSIVLWSVLFLGFVAVWTGPVRADDAPDAQAVISRQLDAFAHDDAAGAFALAAPPIQEKFTDAATFMAMVKSTYPPVYRHRSVQFGKLSREGDDIHQGVVFIDPDNNVWGGVYVLAKQPDGTWRIAGCVLVRSAETSL